MQNKPSRLPGLPRIILVLGLGFLLLWMFLLPVTSFLSGHDPYHVGFNPATDHECISRIIQWCH